MARTALSRRGRETLMALAVGGLLLLAPALLLGQAAPITDEVFANSEIERYLRVLQVAGVVAADHPWAVRAFGPRQVDRMVPAGSRHPWAARHPLTSAHARGPRFALIAPRVETTYNSAFPWGGNDGAVWTGRGLTTAVRAGAVARWGPLSATLAPVVFRAENKPFALAPNDETGELVYAHATRPTRIDLPQRFGDAPYARLDAGQSSVRLDVGPAAIGASTANQQWGPADRQPLLLGTNAPGFLHAFVGTAAPVNIGFARVHGRVVWGRLEQSAFTANTGADAVRFGTGMVVTLQPRGLDNLEFGLARFYHQAWQERDFFRAMDPFLKRSLAERTDTVPGGQDRDNQLASVFLRWVLPTYGLEVFGEYGREDHNWNLRDALLQPDHSAAYSAGFQRTWRASRDRLLAVRGEVVNSEASHLAAVRRQGPWYTHARTRQGHTHRGQLLGSPAAAGGRGASLAWDAYSPDGRLTIGWERLLRRPAASVRDSPEADPAGPDVVHALGVETLRFFRGYELTAGVTAVHNFNRDYGSDAFNLRAGAAVRIAF